MVQRIGGDRFSIVRPQMSVEMERRPLEGIREIVERIEAASKEVRARVAFVPRPTHAHQSALQFDSWMLK